MNLSSRNYMLPKFAPFTSSGGICRPSSDYHSMESHQSTYKYERPMDNAFIKANGGTAYSTMNGGKKKTTKKKKSATKKKSTTKKKKTQKK